MTEYQDMKLTDRYVGTQIDKPLGHSFSRRKPHPHLADERCVKLGSMPEDGATDGIKLDELDPAVKRKVRERREAIDAVHSAVPSTATPIERFMRLWDDTSA